jgi:thiol-disulfide isomerase/thioredoxin
MLNTAGFMINPMSLKLLLFTASCQPCKAVKPIVQELAEEYRLPYEEVGVDRDSTLPRLYGIMSAPTLVFLHGNEVVDKISGVKTKSFLRSIIESRLSMVV